VLALFFSRLGGHGYCSRGFLCSIIMKSRRHTVLLNGVVMPGHVEGDVFELPLCWFQ